MRYTEFREAIRSELLKQREGLTWKELKERKQLPYDRPCGTWTRWLEKEIGLRRIKKEGIHRIRRTILTVRRNCDPIRNLDS